jgi:hypothetical protein
MLKTYRIIPFIFILFLFGFTLITVSPVIAEDSSEFVACQQIKPSGNFRLMKQKKNCFRDVARSLQGQSGDSVQSVAPLETSGGEVAELNVTIAALQSQVATLTTTNAQLQEPLNAKIAELNAENARLLAIQNAPSAPSGGEVGELNARIDELKGDLKYSYGNLIVQRCNVNFLKERLVKQGDTNPFHGSRRPISSCYSENDGISLVGNGKEYSYYFGRK